MLAMLFVALLIIGFIALYWDVCLFLFIVFLVYIGVKSIYEYISKQYQKVVKEKYEQQLYVWNLCRKNNLLTLETKQDYKKLDKVIESNKIVNEKRFKKAFLSILNDEDLLNKFETAYQQELKIKKQQEQKKKEALKKQKQREIEQRKLQEQRAYTEKAELIYRKCKSLELNSFKNDEQLYALKLVANNFGVDDLNVAKKMFFEMQKREDDAEKEEKQKELEKTLRKEIRTFKKEQKKSKLIDKDRYNVNSKYNEQLKMKLIENINKTEFDKLIKYEAKGYTITDTKTFYVNINIKTKKEIKILKEDGILDGTLKINVLDKDKNVVAIGYLNGSGTYPKLSGFSKENTVICIPYSKSKIKKKEKYTIEVIPLHMWIIEK